MRKCSSGLLVALAILPRFAVSAGLSCPDQSLVAGQSAISSIGFSAEAAQISGVQFDLEWDPALGVQITSGAQIGGSGKVLYAAPLTKRSLRVLIAGGDSSIISDGPLLTVFLSATGDPGAAGLRITNAIGAASDGSPVAIQEVSATIRIDPPGETLPVPLLSQGVLNAASFVPGPVAPGEIITLLGSFGIDPVSETVTALVNGTAAPILYAGGNQVNATIPFDLDLAAGAKIELQASDRQLGKATVPTTPAAPALFTMTGTGLGAGAILNEDYTVNSASNPAALGSIVMMYGTGFGGLTPPVPDGQLADSAAVTTLPVTATVGGVNADVLYAGTAPGLTTGAIQINVRIPPGAAPNLASPIAINVGSSPIPAGVSVAIQ